MTVAHKDPNYVGEPNEEDIKYERDLLKEALSTAMKEIIILKRRLKELGEDA